MQTDPRTIPDLIHDLADVYRRIDRLLERASTDNGWIFVQREIIENPRLFVPPQHIDRLTDHYAEATDQTPGEVEETGLIPCADVPTVRGLISEAVDLFLEQLAKDGIIISSCLNSGFSDRFVDTLDAIRGEWRQTCAERVEALRLESRRLQLESLAQGKRQATTAHPKRKGKKQKGITAAKAIEALQKAGDANPLQQLLKKAEKQRLRQAQARISDKRTLLSWFFDVPGIAKHIHQHARNVLENPKDERQANYWEPIRKMGVSGIEKHLKEKAEPLPD